MISFGQKNLVIQINPNPDNEYYYRGIINGKQTLFFTQKGEDHLIEQLLIRDQNAQDAVYYKIQYEKEKEKLQEKEKALKISEEDRAKLSADLEKANNLVENISYNYNVSLEQREKLINQKRNYITGAAIGGFVLGVGGAIGLITLINNSN